MRSVQLRMRAGRIDADEAFTRISDFARYSELVDVVQSVVVHPAPPGAPIPSDWAVSFRNGVLRWSEVDRFDARTRRIVFEQTTGDFKEFRGDWRIHPAGGGCEVAFNAEFDFGIPSLAGILDPIAARVLKETIASVIAGLLGDVTEIRLDPRVPAARTVETLTQSRAA